jgi:hypothetical protein
LPSLYWNGTTPVFYKQEMDGEKQNWGHRYVDTHGVHDLSISMPRWRCAC